MLVVDRHPGVRSERMPRPRGNDRVPGHDPGRDAPIVFAVLRLAPRADEKAALEIHDFEDRHAVLQVVLVALAALEKRIGLELARMQEGHVARIDPPFDRLEVIGLLQALGNEAPIGRHPHPFELGRRGLELRRPHVDPHHVAPLDRWVGLQLDPLAHSRFLGLRGQVHALAVHVVFPAVVGAAQAALLVPAEPQRHAAVRAEFVDHADAPLTIAESYEFLAHDLHAHGRAVRLRDLPGVQRGDPVAPE